VGTFYVVSGFLGWALAAVLAVMALAALIFNRPTGILSGAAARLEAPDGTQVGDRPSVRSLGLIVLVVAIVLAAAILFFPPIGLVAVLVAFYILRVRRRRTDEKYAGLRVLK
jgi:hypothetical protein